MKLTELKYKRKQMKSSEGEFINKLEIHMNSLPKLSSLILIIEKECEKDSFIIRLLRPDP